jgi:DNA-binding transcriptional regulator YiaG
MHSARRTTGGKRERHAEGGRQSGKDIELDEAEKPFGRPRLGERIKRLRKSLDLSQDQFGRRLNCSAMAVSRWERGQRPPTACLLAMGKIAGPPSGWYFWNIAGITIKDVRIMLEKHH